MNISVIPITPSIKMMMIIEKLAFSGMIDQ